MNRSGWARLILFYRMVHMPFFDHFDGSFALSACILGVGN